MEGSTTPPRLDTESEDDYYMRLLGILANEKLALRVRIQEQEEEEEKERKRIKKLSKKKKSKRGSKRDRKLFKKEEDSDMEIKNAKKKKEERPVVVNEVTERLQKFVENKMNGSDLKMLIQKSLTASDLSHGQNRLNMPALQLETNDFLTAEEGRIVKEKTSVIEVVMFGPNLRMYDKMIDLKIWDMQCSYNYVLKNNWYNFVKEYDRILKEGIWIQVWSFRLNEKLCLAVVCPDGENEIVGVNEV